MSIRSYVIVGAVAAVLAGGAAFMVQDWRYGAQIAVIDRNQARQLEQLALATVKSVEAARSEEGRRTAVVENERDNAKEMARAASADAVTARSAASGLRERIDQIHADAIRRDPTLADGGPAAGTPVDMLAHVLGRAIDTAEQLAAYADSARIAGLTCERTYDGVRAAPGAGK